jgi:hypothetical protein
MLAIEAMAEKNEARGNEGHSGMISGGIPELAPKSLI